MHVRLTYVKMKPDKINEMVSIYNSEIIPAAKQAKGNVDIFLLEPITGGEDFISVTRWHSKIDAELYEASGLYKALVGKVAHTFTAAPVLKAYEAK